MRISREDIAAVRAGGTIQLGQVSLEGTKTKANAAKHWVMNCGRTTKELDEFEEETTIFVPQGDTVDQAEDALCGEAYLGATTTSCAT